MSNSFDFELVADDKVSGAIERINESLNDLQPKLDKTRTGLQFGGQETLDGLNGYNSRLELMAQSARDNVQYIGDMVPPLKMVGDISGKLEKMAKIGLVGGAIGGVAYATGKLAESYREASREAYNLDVSSKNAGMRVDDFSRLAGALQFVGADSESASSSIEGFAKALKEASSGSNQGMMAAFATIGVQIQKNKDGSVDTLKTLQEIARIFPKYRPEQQKSIADSLGLTPEMLALMREGERMKTLLVKSDKVGLTVDPALNQQLTDFNSAINEVSASWDGFKSKVERKIYSHLDNNGITDTVRGASDMLENNFDNISIGRFSGQNKGDDSALMRRALRDPEFIKQLDGNEKNQLTAGVMTDQARNKYRQYYYNQDRSQQLRDDISAITRPEAPGRNNVPYNQGGQYDSIFSDAGKKWGVDPRLLKAIMMQESGGNPNAISDADARGLMQIIPPNFKATGITDWKDPNQNINAGAQILSENLQRSGGDVPLALRYYHGGYDRRRWGPKNQAYPYAVLDNYQQIIKGEARQRDGFPDIPINGQSAGSGILQPIPNGSRSDSTLTDNLARSLKEAMSDQPLKLEITMVNDKGERKTYNVENNGRITTPMNY
ncbi:hypothetical protein EB837_06895 [Kluyvera ascorbata]|uniref:Transglycosylase SLT domain-containing protein n=1 Tax=Kluyvera ascorbata TaxID=51288 RepID=A0A3N2S8S5_9ENTR|nr:MULTISPECIES: lytic transglycosylase domain-containing protein [Enterobacteriaceae]QLS13276.1 lytic transglycosylase domain-containing protein [Citrobacter freundii]ROU16115.1 hypothetical protein EB837_06895 [Kluyvera ascorbata]